MFEVAQRINIHVTDAPTPPATGVLSSSGASFVAEHQTPLLLIGVVAFLLVLAFFLFRNRSVRKLGGARLGIGLVALVLVSVFALQLIIPTRANSILTLSPEAVNVEVIKPELQGIASSVITISTGFLHTHTATLTSVSDDRLNIALNGYDLSLGGAPLLVAENAHTSRSLNFTVTITEDLPPGEYYAYIAHAVEENPPDTPTDMQAMNRGYCDNHMVVGQTIVLTDTRNNQNYSIRKLADGNCWMISNLRLGRLDSTMQLTPADTNISENWTLPQVALNSNSSWTEPLVDGPVSGDNEGNSYGFLYNWCAATAGGLQSGGTANTCAFNGSDISSSVDGDICPVGWRIPRGGEDDDPNSEFSMLSARMAGFANNSDPNYLLDPSIFYTGWLPGGEFNGTFSGHRHNNVFSGQGVSGMWWSSTPHSVQSHTFFMQVNHNSVGSYPFMMATHRFISMAVLCVLK